MKPSRPSVTNIAQDYSRVESIESVDRSIIYIESIYYCAAEYRSVAKRLEEQYCVLHLTGIGQDRTSWIHHIDPTVQYNTVQSVKEGQELQNNTTAQSAHCRYTSGFKFEIDPKTRTNETDGAVIGVALIWHQDCIGVAIHNLKLNLEFPRRQEANRPSK